MDEDFKDVLEEPNYKKYYKYIIGGIIIFILFLTVIIFYFVNQKETKMTNIKVEKETNNELLNKKDEEEIKEEIKKFRVDIKGEINSPGVYELEEEKRIIDVINVAGGLTENADTSYLNLSKKLSDEMVIIIYSKEQIKEFQKSNIVIEYVEKECDCPDNLNDACINVGNKNSKSNTKNNTNNKISDEANQDNNQISNILNINTATLEQLQTLTGVGESKAKKIIEYREQNGNFETIEDIKKVSGIGDAMYEKIKDNITV